MASQPPDGITPASVVEPAPLRRLHPATLAAAAWSLAALSGIQVGLLRGRRVEGVRVWPPVPRLPDGARRGVIAVLIRTRRSCLVRSLVLQAWDDAHGQRRDIIIGTTAPSEGFRAHAWLDGDASHGAMGFAEIHRLPAPSVRRAAG